MYSVLLVITMSPASIEMQGMAGACDCDDLQFSHNVCSITAINKAIIIGGFKFSYSRNNW